MEETPGVGGWGERPPPGSSCPFQSQSPQSVQASYILREYEGLTDARELEGKGR